MEYAKQPLPTGSGCFAPESLFFFLRRHGFGEFAQLRNLAQRKVQRQTARNADGGLTGVAGDLTGGGHAVAENEVLKHEVAQHHDDLAADGAQQRKAEVFLAAGAEDQRCDHGGL